MFEQALEDASVSFFVDQREATLCSEYGIPLHGGDQEVTYVQAVQIVRQAEKLYLSVPLVLRKRYRAIFNSLRNAFGPEFWNRYPDLMSLDDKAFRPKTRWA